jgi:hypothetical protein
MIDTLYGKITKLAYHTTKTGKSYIKFCLTETRETMDDKFGKEWFFCTYWDTMPGLEDGIFALVYGNNVKNPDKNDPNKIFNNFSVKYIQPVQAKENLNITSQRSDKPYLTPMTPTTVEDVPF